MTGDNGIIKNANDAKEQTEIAEEKEIVDRATIQAMGNNKRGNLTLDELQKQLNKITDSGKTEVSDNGEEFEIVFADSNRYYTVDKDGKIIEEGKIVIDKSPGDITKDENGNTLKGDESEPYEIWCIEDLVEWTENYGKYQNSNIMLCKNLNFKSKYSYTNSETKKYGDVNEDGSVDSLIKELQSGKGFTPITYFYGRFEGNNKAIKDIYINSNIRETGFFSLIDSSTIIKDFSISGIIRSNGQYVGGITATIKNKGEGGKIENCHNYAKLLGIGYIGGIIGYINNNSQIDKIINCSNAGDITIIEGEGVFIGGIVANTDSSTLVIENCFNTGNNQGSGIAGNSKGYIKNSYNTGKVKYGLVGTNQGKISNCYSIGESSSKYLVNYNYYTNSHMDNCTYLIDTASDIATNNNETSIDKTTCLVKTSVEMKEENFLNSLNQNSDGVVNVWTKDTKNINNGYPILIWQNEDKNI